MKRALLATITILFFLNAKAQVFIDHWETVVKAEDNWRYFRGTQQPNSNWRSLFYLANNWPQGQGGIGFGDGDDSTVVQGNITSLYIRRIFSIDDTTAIGKALLDIDYDDAFIAYINGVEVARNNVGNPANYNTTAFGEHEALMYNGGQPERYEIPKSQLTACLSPGFNVLAIQVHNVSQTSSDMTVRPYLSLGIIDSVNQGYGPTPEWFTPPFQFFSSTLPIVILNTGGQAIVDNPRIMADMGIIDNGAGAINHVNDAFNNYTGKITIEYRGSSTQGFPKKQYGVSTVNEDGTERNVSLLGMPKENDWIFNAPYTDKTMMREFLTYNWARNMGQYATRTRYFELVIDGQYQGVYMLLEKIKWDKNRVDIPRLQPQHSSGDSLTGGYIFKIDKFTGSGGGGWWSTVTDFQGAPKNTFFQYHYPQTESITPEQGSYIQMAVDSFEASLLRENYTDDAVGYRKFIDVPSFIDFFLINEITKNVDGYRLSTFLHKQINSLGGKIYAGPVWDFNITLGNADYCAGDAYTGWALDFPCDQSVIPFWWSRMHQDTTYKKQLLCRWNELRTGILNTQTILNSIDSLAAMLQEPQQRNYTIWPVLGTYVWPNNFIGQTYADEVNYLKDWLTNRLTWMDENLALLGDSVQPTGSCASVQAGSIVVSEVNYNSENSIDAGDWFEIKNISTQTVDLSNWTFRDAITTNVYTIPAGTTVPANGYLVLFQDALLFNQQYPGITNKVGPFNFGLGNSGDEIYLFDAQANPVFSMAFSDSAGWSNAADGIGYTLELLDENGDPNNPNNWFPGCVGGSPGTGYVPCSYPIVFSEINYNSSITADADDWVEIHNTTGQAINISNYVFLDENDTLPFTIPANTILQANGYLVLFRNNTLFTDRHPFVSNKVGPFQFGLGGGGDACRLFDATGKLVVSLYYDDEGTWPTEPDGTGYTLELLSATGNMSEGTNWFAGCPEGSPGGPYVTPCNVSVAEQNAFNASAYPNPFTDRMVLQWESTGAATTHISLFDMYGRIVSAQTIKAMAGINRYDHFAPGLPAGMYMLRLEIDGVGTTAIRMIKE